MNKNINEGIGGKHFSIAISLILVFSGMGFLPYVGDGQDEGVESDYRDELIQKEIASNSDPTQKSNTDPSEITFSEATLENDLLNTNIPPLADAGPDQTVYLGYVPWMHVDVNFDGSGTHDPDGNIIDYSWDFGDGRTGSGEYTTHEYFSQGNYIVTLTVTDNEGATGIDTVIITVIQPPPGTIATDKYSYDVGESVNIIYTGVHGSPMTYTPPGPFMYHFIIKNEDNETVVEVPYFAEYGLTVVLQWWGTVSWTWNQDYRIYGPSRNPSDTIPPTGEQVPNGTYYVWFDAHDSWGLIGPAEFEIGEPPEPLEITTDKYTYYVGEPVNITYTGLHGPSGYFAPPGPIDLHFIIKNEYGEKVVEEPLYTEIHFPLARQWYGIVNWTWNQEYRIYGGNRTPEDTIPPSGDQVLPGKYYVWFDTHHSLGLIGPAEFEIGEPPEPLEITTDKYTYYVGEQVQITITGYRFGSSSLYGRGYLIKDEFGNWVRDPPQIITEDIWETWHPFNHTWDQGYDLLFEYDIYGNYHVNYPNNNEQVPTGKYYIYPTPGHCEPAEIEIIEREGLELEKEKISGPDEVLTHTYHEWELRIVISGPSPNNSYENVIVHDVLPAELELLEYELSQGTLDVIKKGKGKMGATHLTWFVGNLSGDAELTMRIGTRQNPAGKQEFTSPGNYSLNDGAWLEAISCSTGEKIEKGPTDPIIVTALENPNYNNKKSP